MSENDRELREGLRSLATAGPREASPRVEQQLLGKFRARSHRRRLAVWGSAAAAFTAIAAAAATIVLWSWTHAPSQQPMAESAQRTSSDAAVSNDDPASSFYPLPDADALPPVETSMVVRVQMPGSSLRLLGYPVDENFSAEPVQADVLLGQDGLARGVRLIQE